MFLTYTVCAVHSLWGGILIDHINSVASKKKQYCLMVHDSSASMFTIQDMMSRAWDLGVVGEEGRQRQKEVENVKQ